VAEESVCGPGDEAGADELVEAADNQAEFLPADEKVALNAFGHI
jgi:hypothetical protein